jgi:hypothetical protein
MVYANSHDPPSNNETADWRIYYFKEFHNEIGLRDQNGLVGTKFPNERTAHLISYWVHVCERGLEIGQHTAVNWNCVWCSERICVLNDGHGITVSIHDNYFPTPQNNASRIMPQQRTFGSVVAERN